MKSKIVYGLLALLLLAACQASAAPSQEGITQEEVPRITPQQVKAQLEAGEKLILADARSLESYEERHIAGSISVPLTEVEDHLGELPKRAHIVLYCT